MTGVVVLVLILLDISERKKLLLYTVNPQNMLSIATENLCENIMYATENFLKFIISLFWMYYVCYIKHLAYMNFNASCQK